MIREKQALLINSLAKSAIKLRSKMKYPNMEEQKSFLMKEIKDARKTIYGRKYNFDEIRTIQDFQNYIPIVDYKKFSTWIPYMLKGEKNITHKGEIPLFAVSSGTTGKEEKYIPVTKKQAKHQIRGSSEVVGRYLKNNPESKLFIGNIIIIGGSAIENPYNDKDNVWYMSAILQKYTPSIGNFFKIPGEEISFIKDWEERTQKIIELTIDKNITGITGIPSWCIQFLYKVLEHTGKKNILEVRPNFELFIGGGMAVDLYKEQLAQFFPGDQFKYYQVYNASEGFFAIQTDNQDESMMLLTDNGVFYEFIPFEEFGKDNPLALTLDQVETGKDYVLVITTNAGLRRYIIGDVVQFTSLHPYKIKITGRTKYYIDVAGERLTLDYTDKALNNICQEFGLIATDYTIGPKIISSKEERYHQWIIEFVKIPHNIKDFEKKLDEEICNTNELYYQERIITKTLGNLIIHPVKSGTLNTWLRKCGKTTGQSKVPKLANHREYLDSILEMLRE